VDYVIAFEYVAHLFPSGCLAVIRFKLLVMRFDLLSEF
jgi:hypothetical protein